MIARIVLPLPIPKTFSYRVPSDLQAFARPLIRVKVPFVKRILTGLVLALEKEREDDPARMSDITDLVDLVPLVDRFWLDLCSWAAGYYCAPLGLAVKALFPLFPDLERYLVFSAEEPLLAHLNGLRLKKAYAAAGKEKVWTWCFQGAAHARDIFTGQTLDTFVPEKPRGFSASLLYSDAGSRLRTYLSLAEPLVDAGFTVLLLLPDHGMGGEYFREFLSRKMGERVMIYGSQVSTRTRAGVFFRARRGGGYLVIGTRSCLSLPMAKPGLIIVERPEDDGYRNDQYLQFNAAEMALKRAELEGIPILYGSVSPPLAMARGVREGVIKSTGGGRPRVPLTVVTAQKARVGEGSIPEWPDLVREGFGSSGRIAIHTPLKDYAARLFCLGCRKPLVCPDCGSGISLRKKEEKLICSRCRRQSDYVKTCPYCGSLQIAYGSTGAEYVEEQVRAFFPDAPVVRVTGEVIRNKGKGGMAGLLRKPGVIVVGTGVLSKLYGLDVDRLILTGWEDFFRIAGYRARERIYQTYCHLVDALRPSDVCLVTTEGARVASQVLEKESEVFYNEELEMRQAIDFPPYCRLFLVRIGRAGKAPLEVSLKRVRTIIEECGLEGHLVGETVRPGTEESATVLLKGPLLPEGFIEAVCRLPGVRIEPDPLWV